MTGSIKELGSVKGPEGGIFIMSWQQLEFQCIDLFEIVQHGAMPLKEVYV